MATQGLSFPESCQRSSGHDADDDLADDSDFPSPSPYSPYPSVSEHGFRGRSASPPIRIRSNSVMRLENILNDFAIDVVPSSTRSRSLDARPSDIALGSEPGASGSSSTHVVSATTPEGRPVKKKKVKMHYCAECQRGFPRPSGLRTHMNMHTKEKPYPCGFPGCTRSFSVVSNAKRHMRTHGLFTGTGNEPFVEQYVVGFEEPLVASTSDNKPDHPLRLKWVGSASDKGKRSSADLDQEPSTSATV